MSTPNLHNDLHYLIAKYLSHGPCQQAGQVLIEQLEQNKMIPHRLNWLGETFGQDFKTYDSKLSHISQDHLVKLLEKLMDDSDKASKSGKSEATSTIFANKGCSLLARKINTSPTTIKHLRGVNVFQRSPLTSMAGLNSVHSLFGRELTGSRSMTAEVLKPSMISERLQKSCRTLGHLTAAYCVLVDVTGKYIFTGADDKLVKIWSLEDGRLLFTLRGSTSEITDLAVNYENTLLATSCNEKLIRVWCLRTGVQLATLSAHSGSVTSVFFCPIPRSRSNIRYLASTASDGSCAFWAYQEEPGCKAVFNDKPTLYQERMRPGQCKMLCSSFSPGGIFMAAGSADNNVRVYYMLGAEGPERILEVESHSDKVDSISWAHRGVRFISGSRDGTALVWRYEHQQWLFVRIQSTIGDEDIPIDPKLRNRVTMVAWNADDSLVLTAISNFKIKIWNPANGELVRTLGSHIDEVYCVEANPINPRIVCTAGHDGNLFVWDIGTISETHDSGKKLYSYHNNMPDGQGHASVFDVKWSPDGLSLAATDSYGFLMIFSSSQSEKFKRLPEHMFFHTDYRPVIRDAITGVIYDEQTQLEPHLMPPPFLVDFDGNPYPPEFQRLVPGRERCKDVEQLIPNVAVFPEGFQIVIEGAPVPVAPQLQPVNPRSNIEELIERLAAEQEELLHPENEENPERRAEARRSGEGEGGRPRHSSGNWQAAPVPDQPKGRTIVPKLGAAELVMSEKIRHAHGDEEDDYYQNEKTKPPVFETSQSLSTEDIQARTAREIRSRRIRQLAARAAEQRRLAEADEEQQNAREGVARPNPPQREYSMQQAPRRRPAMTVQQAQRRRRRMRYSVRPPDRDRDAAAQSDHESSESSFTSDDATSTSSSESSDSDWGGGGPSTTTTPRKSTSNTTTERRRTARHASTSPPQVEHEPDIDSDMDYQEPQPGPSSMMTKIKVERAEPQKPQPRPARRAKRAVVDVGGLEDIDEKYRPSEWLSELMPKKSPYFPQLGDDLVYFRQGHENYIDEVKRSNIYPLSKKYLKTLPWCANPSLPTQIAVRVVGINFQIKPPRLCCLKLEIMDWESGEPTRSYINNVIYHDVCNVVDFLVLRQVYDKAMRHRWSLGDRFRCLIDRVWWIGSIKSVQPLSSKFPDSKFLCYGAEWANADEEKMSPWDLEVIPDDFEIPETATVNEGIPASEEDLHSDLYEADARDWPPFGHQEVECQRIAALFEDVMGLAAAEHFLTPVDLNKYPEYIYEIPYPVDLNTIKTRLENRFYRRLDALKFDIKHIAINAEQFNRPMTDIVKKARIIRDLCLQISGQPELTEVTGIYRTLSNKFKWDKIDAPSTPAKGKPSVRQPKNSTDEGDRNGVNGLRNKLRPRNNFARRNGRGNGELSKNWHESCRELLEKLWQSRDSEPFRKAVDPTEYPDYYRQIDTPMDLMSVKEDLLGGNYSAPQEFARDMRLIFSNSRAFNTDKHSQIHIMTIRLSSLFECQMGPILDDHRRRKNRSSRKRDDKFITATPTKGSSSRSLRNTERSLQSTPRKNPRRSAASKNPYVHSEDESHATSGEEEPIADGDQYRDHRRKRRRRSGGQQAISSTRRGSVRQIQSSHDDSISPPIKRTARQVKRLRINSSGDSASPPRQAPAPRASRNTNSNVESPRKTRIKTEPEEHNLDDSDSQMPELSKQPGDSDSEYEEANESGYHENRRRRSLRVVKAEEVSSRGRHRPRKNYREDDNDYSDNEGGRRTRFRGKKVANYQESEEELMQPVEEISSSLTLADRVKQQSRRNSHSSSNGVGQRNSGSNRAETSEEEEEDLGEEEVEEEELGDEDDEQPGPSSRMRPAAMNNFHVLRSQPRVKKEEEEYEVAVDEEEEEEGDDDDDEDYSENSSNRSSRGTKRRRTSNTRGSRRRRISSHDDEEPVAKRTPRKGRQLQTVERTINLRETRPRTSRKNYNEDDSDEDAYHPNIHVKVTVSSRGRVRKRKEYDS